MLRAELAKEQGYCCKACGRPETLEGLIRDHIRPLAEHGEDIKANTQMLCRTCSDLKSQEEANRGKRRG